MSRHVPRHERWTSHGPTEHRSGPGLTVYFRRGAWWAEVAYRTLPDGVPVGPLAPWRPHTDVLGPFKRPRNAMVAAEQQATFLRRRHGDRVALGPAGPADETP
jgi:hypothetical protein